MPLPLRTSPSRPRSPRTWLLAAGWSALGGCGGEGFDDGKVWSTDGGGELVDSTDDGGSSGGDTGGDTGDDDTGTSTDPVELDLDPDCSPFAMAADCLTPWPSVFHTREDGTSPTGLRLDYSLDGFASPDGELPVDPAMFNFADGASPVSPILVNLGRDVDPDLLWGPLDAEASLAAAGPIVLVDLESGARVPLLTEMDQNQRDMGYEGRHALVIRPMAPLRFGGRYAVALTTDLVDTEGTPFTVSPGFAAMRDGVETTDPRIEGARARYDTLFSVLDTAGVPRESLLVAFELPVASEAQVLGPIQSMMAAADIENAAGVPYTIESVDVDPTDHAWLLVKGTFQPPNFLTADNELVLDGTTALLQGDVADRPAYPFTLFVPADAQTTADLPLAIIGHGLFGTGRSWLDGGTGRSYVQPGLASAGAIGVATDWIGLSQGDLDLIISEVVPDIARIQLITDRLAQSLVNTHTLVALVRTELAFDPAVGWTGDGTHVHPETTWYYGGSLGGIQGASFTAISPDVSRAGLGVPGAGWSTMLQRSIHYGNIELVVDALYPDPLAQSAFLAMLQTFFDRSDPAGLARSLADDDSKVVVLQEAIGDVQVPNISTDLLARAIGAHHLDEAPYPVAGLDLQTGPTAGPALSQYILPDALAEYTPPETNTTPTEENGVHGDAPTSVEALTQLAVLLETGMVVHPCDGPCDPD